MAKLERQSGTEQAAEQGVFWKIPLLPVRGFNQNHCFPVPAALHVP